MRVLTEEGWKRRKEDSERGRAFCLQDCSICFQDTPVGPKPSYKAEHETSVEVRRLTLENSLLRGELAALRAHAKLSREG